MKKIFAALLVMACVGMTLPVQAQIHFGVKGGLNLSKASFSHVEDNFKKDNFTGFFIGIINIAISLINGNALDMAGSMPPGAGINRWLHPMPPL